MQRWEKQEVFLILSFSAIAASLRTILLDVGY